MFFRVAILMVNGCPPLRDSTTSEFGFKVQIVNFIEKKDMFSDISSG